MPHDAVNLLQKSSLLPGPWLPRVVAEMNDYQFKVARLEGDFIWHAHQDTDETFLVLDGHLRIELRDGEVRLGPGDLYVVPRGVEHKPCAAQPVRVLLIEPRGVVNTGDAGGERTVENDVWI